MALDDFNILIDPSLECVPTRYTIGREELLDWQLRLVVVDDWRATHPLLREFTGPVRRNCLDYVFASPALFEHYLTSILHVSDSVWHYVYHLPVSFTLQSPLHPQRSKLTWKCPIWLLKFPVVAVLERTLDAMRARLAHRA